MMSTLIIVDGMHTIIVVCRQRWIKSYWMTETGKSLDEHRKGRPEEPIMVVLMKLHTNSTLSFVRIGNNGKILKNKILPLAVVVLITFTDRRWTLAIHFLQLLNDIEGHEPIVTFVCM
jgi:hypothetical protein